MKGIAQALGLAENFVGFDSMTVIPGHNIFETNLKKTIDHYPGNGAQIPVEQVEDPERFGVADIEGDQVVGIEEKPDQPKSDFAVTGIYMYDAEVFVLIKHLKPSTRGELEITDVNNDYIKRGEMKYPVLDGCRTDAVTPESYNVANQLAYKPD